MTSVVAEEQVVSNNGKSGQGQLVDKVVNIGRVTKVVKGGRIFRFTATVIVGDENGSVGIGYGKAREVPDAIQKALEDAKKNVVQIPLVNGTIPHDVIGIFGASEVVMRPAAPGTGIIAGGAIRSLFRLAGIENILAKSFGSRNYYNMLYAVMQGFKEMRTLGETAHVRDLPVSHLTKK